ncbi:hypothetical protein ASPFODRAFT_617828 [Aspergillus luchuensis CBS 106.47]|uniref:Uncharacterized protein n=1 Tax=Aspergillus luchuensis (strain CBS 106.47) TaxID=1137211 RepID=A0A1M3TJG9_ASPLC|nr:hypothetical protein ASPFODRAFT_617828 [Aspergillus luchuensis CBS 106.47]
MVMPGVSRIESLHGASKWHTCSRTLPVRNRAPPHSWGATSRQPTLKTPYRGHCVGYFLAIASYPLLLRMGTGNSAFPSSRGFRKRDRASVIDNRTARRHVACDKGCRHPIALKYVFTMSFDRSMTLPFWHLLGVTTTFRR